MAASQNGDGEAAQREFGRRLEAAARAAGYNNPREMADKLGVTRAAVASWWNGTHGLARERLRRYAELTGRPISWFYGEDEPEGSGPAPERVPANGTMPGLIPEQVAEVFRLVLLEGLRLDAALDRVTGRPELLTEAERRLYRENEPRLRRILETESRHYLEYFSGEGVIRLVEESLERFDRE